MIELNKAVARRGRVFGLGGGRLIRMLNEKRAIVLKEGQHLVRQRIDGFFRDHPQGHLTPAERSRQDEQDSEQQ